MTSGGVRTYTLDNSNASVQGLNSGQHLTHTFTVPTADRTQQLTTLSPYTTLFRSVISGTTAGTVVEAGGVANATPGTPTVSGTLTDTDVDNTPNTFTAVAAGAATVNG